MERKGITRILTGMLFLSPLISDAWNNGICTIEYRGNWPLTDYAKGIKFVDDIEPMDFPEGIASEELDNSVFSTFSDTNEFKYEDTGGKGEKVDRWEMRKMTLSAVEKCYDEASGNYLAKGNTYVYMTNPMVCIPYQKDPKPCTKKVRFIDPTREGNKPFEAIESWNDPDSDPDRDDKFYALLAPTLYCEVPRSMISKVEDEVPEAFCKDGKLPEDIKKKRETKCFNIRGNAQLFIDLGEQKEAFPTVGEVSARRSVIIYRMPTADLKTSAIWGLHTGPAIFAPELDTLGVTLGATPYDKDKPDAKAAKRNYSFWAPQMDGVKRRADDKQEAFEAVAFNVYGSEVAFPTDFDCTYGGVTHKKEGDNPDPGFPGIEITAAHGGTLRTRVLSTDKDGNNIAFDTLHVILPYATGLALQKEMFMNPDRLALNAAEQELEAIVESLKAVDNEAKKGTPGISVPEKFGFAIECVEKFRNGENFSFDEVSGTGGGAGGAGGGSEEKHTPPPGGDFPGKIDDEGNDMLQSINDQLKKFFDSDADLRTAAGKIDWTGEGPNSPLSQANKLKQEDVTGDLQTVKDKVKSYARLRSAIGKLAFQPENWRSLRMVNKELQKMGLKTIESKKKGSVEKLTKEQIQEAMKELQQFVKEFKESDSDLVKAMTEVDSVKKDEQNNKLKEYPTFQQSLKSYLYYKECIQTVEKDLQAEPMKMANIIGPDGHGKIEVFSAQANLIEAWDACAVIDPSIDLPGFYVFFDNSFIYKGTIGQDFKKIENAIQAIWTKDPDFKAIVDKINWDGDFNADIEKQAGGNDTLKGKLAQYQSYRMYVGTVRDQLKSGNEEGIKMFLPTAQEALKTLQTSFGITGDEEEHHDEAKMEMVFGSSKAWMEEEITAAKEQVRDALKDIRDGGKYPDLKDAIDRVVTKKENLFTVVNSLGSEELKKQLKAFVVGWYLLNEVKDYVTNKKIDLAHDHLGAAQVALHVLQVSLKETKADASLQDENLAKKTEYRTKLGNYNKSINDLENDPALKTIPDTLTEEWKAFNDAIYDCKCQTTALELLIEGMNADNMKDPNSICKHIDSGMAGKIPGDSDDKTYLGKAQDAFTALTGAHQSLIDGIKTEIKNLQDDADGKLGEIKDLAADWTRAEKDILATLGNDVGNQLKAKLYKLYHDAITAAEAVKDTNVGEAKTKLEEAKQYYGAIQALIKDLNEGGCDFTKLAGAYGKDKWSEEDIEAGIKAVAAALDALRLTVPEVEDVLKGKKAEAFVNDGALDHKAILGLFARLQVLEENNDKAMLEACFVAFERLMSAQMVKKNPGTLTGDEQLKKRQKKLGVSQIALSILINVDATPKKLSDELETLRTVLQNFSQSLAEKTQELEQGMKLLHKDVDSGKQQKIMKQIISNKINLLAMKVAMRGMTPENSGSDKTYGIYMKEADCEQKLKERTEGAQTILKDLQTASEEAKKEEIKKSIEAANAEKAKFESSLKDYETFEKAFKAIKWEEANVADQITAQAGGNDELKKQLELYQQYFAAFKEANEKQATKPDEAQEELDKAKQHLTDLKNQLAASYFPKGNPNNDWTEEQKAYYDKEKGYYATKLQEIAKIKKASEEAKKKSLLDANYDEKLKNAEEKLEAFRKVLVELGHTTSGDFGADKEQGKWKVVAGAKLDCCGANESVQRTFLLDAGQQTEIDGFKAQSQTLRDQMKTLKAEIAAWIKEDSKRSVDIQAFEKMLDSELKTVDGHFDNVHNYENIYQYFKSAIESCQTKAQTALDSARQAFESAQKAAGASQEIKDQYNKCNALYTELMTKQSELASKIAKIVIDESWAGKDEVKTKQEEAEKALNEYNTKLAGLKTALNSALNESDQKAALTKAMQDLENAKKELNENINKTVSDFEGAVTEAQKKAQEAAKIAKIPQELAVKNKEIGQKVGRGTQKLNSASWTQFGKVDKAVRKLIDIILNNPSKSLNELIQEENSKIVPAYEDVCKEYDKLQELSPAVSSSQSHSSSSSGSSYQLHSSSYQTSSQTSSSSKVNSLNRSQRGGKRKKAVSRSKYVPSVSPTEPSGPWKSIHDRTSLKSKYSRKRRA